MPVGRTTGCPRQIRYSFGIRHGTHRPMNAKIFFRLIALALLGVSTAGLSARSLNAAELRCLFRTGAIKMSPELRAGILEDYPSGRLPSTNTCREVLIRGRIDVGDSAKFEQFLRENHPFLQTVYLWSPGGSVGEAIKIGLLIRKASIMTQAPRSSSGRG